MTEHIRLIERKLQHLAKLRLYLAYSLAQTQPLMPIQSWTGLTPENHETLAAFRVRFSEYQEHLGKAMRAIAIEEEQKTEPYTAVLLYMEKLGIIDKAERWKELRELRNAINHEYEENTDRLTQFFDELVKASPQLFSWHDRLIGFCNENYGI
jgi:uncharacterized protein YwqG